MNDIDNEIIDIIGTGHHRVTKRLDKTTQVSGIPDVIKEMKHDMSAGLGNKINKNVYVEDLQWEDDVLELDCFVFTRKQLEQILVLSRLSGVNSRCSFGVYSHENE